MEIRFTNKITCCINDKTFFETMALPTYLLSCVCSLRHIKNIKKLPNFKESSDFSLELLQLLIIETSPECLKTNNSY